MKKWIALILCILMLGLCACANTQNQDDTTPQKTPKELAQSCIDKPVEDLYALVGQPESSDYAPSCLAEGGEDGNLYYADFTVYTLRTGDTEIVKDVE